MIESIIVVPGVPGYDGRTNVGKLLKLNTPMTLIHLERQNINTGELTQAVYNSWPETDLPAYSDATLKALSLPMIENTLLYFKTNQIQVIKQVHQIKYGILHHVVRGSILQGVLTISLLIGGDLIARATYMGMNITSSSEPTQLEWACEGYPSDFILDVRDTFRQLLKEELLGTV